VAVAVFVRRLIVPTVAVLLAALGAAPPVQARIVVVRVDRVSRVDGDGNEVAGIRLLAIAVPLGTHTGRNVYREPFPDGELCDRDGTFAAFARTRAERLATGDPRPSLEERYGSHAGYVARVDAAAAELVRARLLLPEDAERIRAAARRADPLAP
jgi:Alpha/beta hydrolase domain